MFNSLDFQKILFISGNIPESKNTTPYQRFKLINQLDGSIFLKTRKKEILNYTEGNIFFSNNTLSQFSKILYFLIKCRLRNIKILLWVNYEPIDLTFAYLCKKLFNVKILADIWDSPSLQIEINMKRKGLKNILKQKLRIFFYNFIKKRLMNFDKIIFSLNPLALKDFNNFDDILSKSLQTTNGIGRETIGLIKCAKEIQKGKDETWIAYIGFITKIRGIDLVLKGIDRVYTELKNFKLILIGPFDKYDKEWFDDKTQNKSWKDRIILTGPLPHNRVIRYLKSSDILLFPFPRKKELEYIYPIKIFEYLTTNKKIVSSDLIGVSSILKKFNGIYFFKAGDVNDFSKKLLLAINDKKKVNNIPILKKYYLWEKINKKILEYIIQKS